MIDNKKYVAVSNKILKALNRQRYSFRSTGWQVDINKELPIILGKMVDEGLILFEYDNLGEIDWGTVRKK